MRNLRKYWLLILLIVIGLLWWHIYDLFMPSPLIFEQNPTLKEVSYWSLITNTTLDYILLLGFILAALLALIQLWRTPTTKPVILTILLTLMCTVSACSSTVFSLKRHTTLQDVMSVQFQNRLYHLAYFTYSVPFDISSSYYYVFECDPFDKICSKIKDIFIMTDNIRNDHLVVSDDKLILDRGFEQIQILPAVNGSS